MKKDIKKTRIPKGIELLKLLLFFFYNFSYVLFKEGYIPQSINLVLLVVFIGICVLQYLHVNHWKWYIHDFFSHEIYLILFTCFVIAVISLGIQIKNGNICGYMFSGILHIVLPIMAVFFWIHTVKEEHRDLYFEVFVLRFIFHFLLIGSGNFSLSNILAISWFDSKSSVFESSNAHDLLFLVFYYKYRKKNLIAFVCMVLCMLSLKRLSFILAPLVFIFFKRLPDKPVSKWLLRATKVLFICSPFFYLFLMSDSVDHYFIQHFNISLNQFMTGRLSLAKIIISRPEILNGYDSTTYYLMHNGFVSTNMHCDVLKMYLEVSIVSLIVLINNIFEIVKKDFRLYLIMMYTGIVLISSHFLDYISGWIIIYMIVACVYYDKVKSDF